MKKLDEKGNFIVISALLAIPLIALIGLAVDGFIAILTVTNYGDVAKLSALGAAKVIRDHQVLATPTSLTQAKQDADARAADIITQNDAFIPGRVFLAGGAPAAVTVTYGDWYPVLPDPSVDPTYPAPCSARPCFIQNTDPDNVESSAVQVQIDPPQLRTLFIQIVYTGSFTFSVKSIAWIDPADTTPKTVQ